jgi:hypothetical protein
LSLAGSSRCRRAALLGLLLVVAVLPVRPAAAAFADRVGATFSLMADDFVKAARPMEATVVSLDGDTVYLDVGALAGAQIGQELSLYRKGDSFLHPITGRPLGRFEEALGWAQIRRVYPQFSEATYVPRPDAPRPEPADGARITRARIRIAVTPVLDLTGGKADVRRVPFLIASVLERSRRFLVADPLAVTDLFNEGALRVEEVLARPERAMGIAQRLEVTGWVVPVLMERQGVVFLDATWISAITGTPLFSRRQPLLPPGGAEEQRFPWEPRAED